ncbi:chloride channel protein [Streptomyces sp. NBC_01387]|uniref:chloride channel protein n=1 Tax=Streptomyces sp. NBC_01500 TaxID=2903886 RepID=UPI002024F6AA|nr:MULTISPECIES: chloride channel protein [unclassified Streptomyces]MCX4550419.1 chloride channel protein [Streptomyces sp. NBC_01500]WSC21873.1 chloride channel protein [Streptomyces sp. NBC_01766]WSV55828.1 chloride channel protein [Streptomyces sp. NBC_01014]
MPADAPVGDPQAALRADPFGPLRSRGYLMLLALTALFGVVISAGAYGFLQAVEEIEKAVYTSLPKALGFDGAPFWWPLPLLALAGLLVAATVQYLPGNGGHQPAEGFKAQGTVSAAELPGVLLAALASLTLGAVVGPEAPLIALGGGIALYGFRLIKPEADASSQALVAAAGSFAAISALLGSPLIGAFLLMEVSGLGGPMLGIVLVPGLLASGIGSLVFTGLGTWAGVGKGTLIIPNLPPADRPDLAQFGYALLIGVAAGFVGTGIRRLGLFLQPGVNRRRLVWTPVCGLVVAGLAIAYAEGSGKDASDVLFSGESALPGLLLHSGAYSAGVLTLLIACKGLAYGVSLSAFRGGPVFPALYIGAAGGIALSHLPGLPFVTGAAMGMGALAVALLRLPMTAVLLATLLLGKSGVTVMPLVIVAVVVCHVVVARISPPPVKAAAPAATAAPA